MEYISTFTIFAIEYKRRKMNFNSFKKTEKKRIRVEWLNMSYDKVVSATGKIVDFYAYKNRWYINLIYMFMFGCFAFSIMNGIDNTFKVSDTYNTIITYASDIYLIVLKISGIIWILGMIFRLLFKMFKGVASI